MAGGILYLDIDDEITSAAARIRTADGRRVAVVLPYGSRVATSRINFRLLSRDALTHEKRLSVVAGDAATRALAASAGLPVFATVAEYEASEEAPKPPRDGGAIGLGGAGAAGAAGAAALAGGAAGAAAGAPSGETARVATPSSTSVRGRKPRSAPPPEQSTLDEMEAAELAAAAATIGHDDAGAGPGTTRDVAPPPRSARDQASPMTDDVRSAPPMPIAPVATATAAGGAAGLAGPTTPTRPTSIGPRVGRARSGRDATSTSGRTILAIGLAIVALVVLVGGVGAYLWLPSATIVVTPKEESVGPVLMTIVADPSVTTPDATADPPVVPAQTVSTEVATSGTFPATGKRVVTAKATGQVRFRNKDFTRSNTIPGGSVVSTANGVKFRTAATVTVPRADIVGLQVFPKTATVAVTAVSPGPQGNVEANTIVVIPQGEDPISLDVNNPDPTTGGKRDEFPKVTQQDIDNAMATLNAQLDAAFVERLKDPSIVAPGSTIFPDTRTLGQATPTTDPTTLLDQEIASFALGLTATGTATAVDEAPVKRVAEERLKAGIDSGHRLVADSVDVTVQPAVVTGGRISFPASATARQTTILDPAALKGQIKGKPLDEARSILERYGRVTMSAWPDWVSTIPTLDGRIDLTVSDAVTIESAAPSPSS